MKKGFCVVLVMVVMFTIFAGRYNIVPLDNEAYRIIEYAQIMGTIPTQSQAKPYDYSTVMGLLQTIYDSDSLDETSRARLFDVIERLKLMYSAKESTGLRSILKNGFYRTSNPQKDITFTIGVKGKMNEKLGVNTSKDKIIDSRNSGTVYIDGDLFNLASYNMNATLKLDKFDTFAYLDQEFLYDADGDYFLSVGVDHTTIRNFEGSEEGIFAGFSASPQLSVSLFKERLKLRFGSYPRDWGHGIGNLVLSSQASEFNGVEFQFKPVSWMNFSVLTGSLNPSSVRSVNRIRRAGYGDAEVQYKAQSDSDAITKKDVSYDNMFSIQRVELNYRNVVNFSLFESVVWKKRLELAYLNPFSIYWFAQSMTGDIDNLIGGFDLSLRIKNLGKLYFALSIDEYTSDLKHIITNPRNIMALQGGAELAGNLFGSFTLFTVQATYIPPFYGSHYYREDNDLSWYATSYVNKGANLFYPLNPDSLELLFKCDMSLNRGWSLSVGAKNQMRSSQYAVEEYDTAKRGTDILTVINYSISDNYAKKQFFKNIWNNTLDIGISFSKYFENSPFKVSFGLDGIIDWTRRYNVDIQGPDYDRKGFHSGEFVYNGGKYNLGNKISVEGEDWNPARLRVVGNLVFTLYY